LRIDPFWLAALLLFFLYLQGVAHRAGHELAAGFTGLHQRRSPIAESRALRLWLTLRYPLPGRLAGRHSFAVHPACADPGRASWFAIVGGPAADLLLFLLMLTVVRRAPSPYLTAATALSGVLFLLNALPLHLSWFESDAATLDMLRHGGASAGRLAALAALEGAVRDGQMPRAFDRTLILRATACPDGSREAALADLFAYYRALDLGEGETAEALLERLRLSPPPRPRAARGLVVGESAFLIARLHNDCAAAEEFMQLERHSGLWQEQRLRAAAQAHPGPFTRTAVQARILLGQFTLAQEQGRAGLIALVRRPPDGPSAARRALCEREWLRMMLKEAAVLKEAATSATAAPAAPSPSGSGYLRNWYLDQPLFATIFGALIILSGSITAWLGGADNVLAPDHPASVLQALHLGGAVATLLTLAIVGCAVATVLGAPARRLLTAAAFVGSCALVILGIAIGARAQRFDITIPCAVGGSFMALGAYRLNGRMVDAGRQSLADALRSLSVGRLLLIGFIVLPTLGAVVNGVARQLGAGNAATTGTTRPGSNAPAIRVRYVYDANVPAYARDDVRNGVGLAAAYFWTTFDRTIQRPVELDVSIGNAAPWALGYADFHQIHIGVGDANEPLSSLSLQNEVVHELFHVLQGELGAGAGRGPAWLVEGSATFVAGEAQVWDGDTNAGDENACWQSRAAAQRAMPPLQTLTSEAEMTAAPARYDLAALAVALATHDTGTASLRAYFAGLATGDWQSAFHQAFGVEPAAFFQRFQAGVPSFRNAPANACNALVDD
jgi:hypothetical protein